MSLGVLAAVSIRRAAICLLALASLLCPLRAQEFRAVLKGSITDPTGSVVPQAKVQVRQLQTNQENEVASDNQGHFTVPFLQPGDYEVSVTAAGFKTYHRTGLNLMVGQTASLDIRLEVGDLAETVRVTSEAPLLDSVKADRGMVIDNQRVTEMPLNGRNPIMISSMLPGVNYNGAAIYFRPFDNGAIATWSINGSGQPKTEYLMDGAPNNAQAGLNNIAAVPGVDAVAEFKIQTNSYDAQYGHTGGGIMSISLKSGTNTLHGTAYEFARRGGWDANAFQNNAARPTVFKPEHVLDQFGFEVDGPVYLPKLYNGVNRTFFMFNLERYQEENPVSILNSFPEMDMRTGDFSKLKNSQGAQMLIYDPTTGNAANNYARAPFAGNIIPASRVNPIAAKILTFFPQPNTVTAGQNYSRLNYQVPAKDANQHERYKTYTTKIDHSIGNQRFFVRHIYTNRDLLRSVNGISGGAGNDGYFPFLRNNTGAVADWVSVVNPSTVFNLRLSFSRYIEGSGAGQNQGFDITTLGFPQSLAAALPNGQWFQRYTFSGYSSLGTTSFYGYTNNFAIHPNVTRIQGAHSLKAGLDMRWIQYNDQTTGNPMLMSSDAGFTRRDWQLADSLTGDAIATFLLGTPSSLSSAWNVWPSYLYRYFAPYIQDDWRISSRLTLNLGFRWDFNLPPSEHHNRMNRGFNQNAVNSVDKLVNHALLPGPVKGSLLFAGVNGMPDIAANLYKRAVQPRVGAAFKLNDQTVLRGGWGRFYVNPSNDYFQTNGFSQTINLDTSLDDQRTSIANVMNNPAPNGIPAPPGNSLGDQTYLGRAFNFVNPNFRLPYVDHFSFGVQRQLPFDSKLEVSYVGSRGGDVQSNKPINNYPAALRDSCNPLTGGKVNNCSDLVANPFYHLAPFINTSLYSNATIAKSTLAQTFPAYGALTEVGRNDGKTWYNSLQIAYEVRAHKGLNLIVAYTLSKEIDRAGWNDVYTDTLQTGLMGFDRTHVFTTTAVYQLPFGPGQRLLGNSGRVLGRIVGGWELNWMATYGSGRPWALPANALYINEAKNSKIDWDQSRVWGLRNSTANGVTAACVGKMNNDGSIVMQPFSKSAGCSSYDFLVTPSYAPRYLPSYDGRLRIMSQKNIDISLNKVTRITESTRLQFRAEAFNAFNHYYINSAGFVSDPNSPLFGSIDKSTVGSTSTNNPRNIQLGVKFIW